MDTEELRVKKIKDYLINVINEIRVLKDINVNILSNNTNSYMLERIPSERVVSQWITGDCIYKDVYNLVTLRNYSYDDIKNLEEIGFFEKFEDLIVEKDKNREYPDIENIESIECLNCGSLSNFNVDTAEFSIKIQITYRK